MSQLRKFIYSPHLSVVIFTSSITVMILIDYTLGSTAEFLNAWFFIRVLVNDSDSVHLHYFYFQDQLGSLALPATLCILILIHSTISVLFTKIIRAYFS